MSQFLVTYLGGNPPATQEEGKRHFQEYQQWLAALGANVVSAMNPIRGTHTVHSNGQVEADSVTKMSGYTIIEADSIEAALEMVASCPFLNIGGELEVSELVQMS